VRSSGRLPSVNKVQVTTQAADLDDASDGWLRIGDGELLAGGRRRRGSIDQRSEPARIHKRHTGKVGDHKRASGHRGEGGRQSWCRVSVNLAFDRPATIVRDDGKVCPLSRHCDNLAAAPGKNVIGEGPIHHRSPASTSVGRLCLANVGFGYPESMVRTLARTAKRLVSPASRPAALVLAWTHRHTVALWCRSIGTEARQQFEDRKPNLSRSKNLLKSLWRVSSDAQLANAPELRRIVVHDAGITVDAVETWPGRYLLDSRLGIDKITNGKVTNDTLKDRPIEPALSEIFGPDGRGTLTH